MADTRIYQDKIGFLGVPQGISFDGGELLLLPEDALAHELPCGQAFKVSARQVDAVELLFAEPTCRA